MEKYQIFANDYHSPFWRNYLWVSAFYPQSKLIRIPQLDLAIRSSQNKMDYLVKLKSWSKTNKQLAFLVNRDINVLVNILEQTVKLGEKMNAYTLKLVTEDLSKYSSVKIIRIYDQHGRYNSLEYAWGTLLPVLDFQNFHFIENKLREILSVKLSKQEIERAFAVFTQPIEDSFAIEQEKSILKIYQNFPKELLKLDNENISAKLKKNYSRIYRQLLVHEQKYAWVFYVYAGPAAKVKDFLETLKFYHKKKINPVKKLKELALARSRLLAERKKYFAELNLNPADKRFVNLVSRFVYLKPRRKDFQSKSYYHLEFLQKEIGRRLRLSLGQVRAMTLEEIKQALNGHLIDPDKLNERARFHIIVPVGKKIVFYQGKAAEKFQRQNIKAEQVKIAKVKEFFGQTGCPGRATGIIKRVDMPEDMAKMNEGDILVSTSTTPSIVPAIRKAAAIITDEGGLTCHAAIVSREFNIPCVIGTGLATKVLKDGDRVEVDATKGIVKKL